MSSPKFTQSVIALSIGLAFASAALAQSPQPLQEVVISAGKWVATDRAGVGGFSDTPLLYTPASVIAFGREKMQDLNIRSTSDAMRFDASVGDAYNAVGYAEQFSIRGFMLDNASSYRKDGIAVSGDTQIPLENKERFEILKGLSGLQAGVSAPGGIVNFVVKRPTAAPLRSATLEARERGTLYGAVDLGGRFGDSRFGYRINAAGERLRSYVRGADGERSFVSGAFDWQISPQALLQLDMDYQRKEQITAPGYQLIRGVALPVNVSPKMLLNAQPWTKPVETTSTNLGLRFAYQLSSDWRATVSANSHKFKRDDFTAFPYGCSNEGDGFYPGYCSNGDYDVYDYQSTGERKSPRGLQALVQGKAVLGGMAHELTFGATMLKRRDLAGDYVYDYAGSSNIYQNAIVPPAPGNPATGPVYERRRDTERALVAQDIIALSEQFKLHAGVRYAEVQRDNRPDASFTLPNLSLVYNPSQDLTMYATVAHGMEQGGVAPKRSANEFAALDPSRSKQLEVGVKAIVNDRLNVAAAVFDIEKGLEYINAANTFVRNGDQTHRGMELSLDGKAGTSLAYSVSLMALDTRQSGTGNASLDGKRVTNVPKFKSAATLEYALPALPGLKVSGIWQYAGKKAFDIENQTMVPGYHVLGLGASYAARVAGMRTTIRASLDNAADKFYWRDVTQEVGGYLFPGAPRTLRVSAQFDF